MTDPRISAPSALRNRGPILEVLRAHLPKSGTLLEIASGTGEHVSHFAAHLPGWRFQPSDPDAARRASIDAWAAGLANVAPAIDLDVTGVWPALRADAVLCVNMIHIAPWAATPGLMRGAAATGAGVLITYGPYIREGVATAEGNLAFDADLRARDPSWGLRSVEDVAREAALVGFAAPLIVEMPANNLCLVFRRAG